MTGILFGSISSIADTSELQRAAFNRAFQAHDLEWIWNRDDYRRMLEVSGGRQRIAGYAASRGVDVDAAAIHTTKSAFFQDSVANTRLTPRSGVAETIRAARDSGAKVGFVSLTSRENISAVLAGLEPAVTEANFDVVLDVTSVEAPKPDKAAYLFAMNSLDEQPSDCIAIEDNVPGVLAAVAAGITCVAFPNGNTEAHDFAVADRRIDRVDFDELEQLLRNE